MLLSQLNPDEVNEQLIENILFDFPTDDLKCGDCIFVFGSSKVQMIERVNKAVELYQQKRASKLLFSGGLGKAGKMPEALLMKEYALSKGVREEDILIETDSNNTAENILCSLVVLQRHMLLQNVHRLLIVTSAGHIKRCILTLSRYMPKWIEYSYCYNEDSLTTKENWKKDKIIYNKMFKEMRNMIFYAKEGYIDDIDITGKY